MAVRFVMFRPKTGWDEIFYLPLPGKVENRNGQWDKNPREVYSCGDGHYHFGLESGRVYHTDEFAEIAYKHQWDIYPVYENLSAAADGELKDAFDGMARALQFQKEENKRGRGNLKAMSLLERNIIALYSTAIAEGVELPPETKRSRWLYFGFGEEYACSLKNGTYLYIQTSSEGGWDYTLYNRAYEELDGGVIESDVSIVEAIAEILSDCGTSIDESMDTEQLRQLTDNAAQCIIESVVRAERRNA